MNESFHPQTGFGRGVYHGRRKQTGTNEKQLLPLKYTPTLNLVIEFY